jgi:hypothetical protein
VGGSLAFAKEGKDRIFQGQPTEAASCPLSLSASFSLCFSFLGLAGILVSLFPGSAPNSNSQKWWVCQMLNKYVPQQKPSGCDQVSLDLGPLLLPVNSNHIAFSGVPASVVGKLRQTLPDPVCFRPESLHAISCWPHWFISEWVSQSSGSDTFLCLLTGQGSSL